MLHLGLGVSMLDSVIAVTGGGGTVTPHLAQAASAAAKVSANTTVWQSSPTSGNLLMLAVVSAGTLATPTGWTLATNASAVQNEAYYLFYRTADGTANDTPSYTLAGNYTSVWSLLEFSGATFTFGQAANVSSVATGQTTINSATMTPTAGNYLIVTSLAASNADLIDNMNNELVNITNSFIGATFAGEDGTLTAGTGQDNLTQTVAYKVATLDGVTVVNTSGDSWGAGADFSSPGSVMLAFTYS